MKKSVVMLASVFLFACNEKFLEEKPKSAFVVPESLRDFQQLLDNGDVMFYTSELAEVMADNYFLTVTYWQNLASPMLKNAYIWAEEPYGSEETLAAWNTPYRQIFYANVVLDGLNKITVNPNNEVEWKRLKGSALFIRAYALHNLAQLFVPVYDEQTSGSERGLLIPLVSDVSKDVPWSTVEETYQRILADLHEAADCLANKRDYARPSRPAVMALLARVYLTMGAYEEAAYYADMGLAEYDVLVDFNSLTQTTYGVREEAIYLSYMNPAIIMTPLPTNALIVPELYGSYDDHDLRKTIYYRLGSDGIPYKGISHQFSYQFTGLATDELFLIRAEARARRGETALAMDDLNHLLKHRWAKDRYVDLKATNQNDALRLILMERRKELVFRNLRWSDLRRLNNEGAGITLQRSLGEATYKLAPESDRWILPIPPDEQNP